jgi:uncharacterized repeat protein (TIGR03847 family)
MKEYPPMETVQEGIAPMAVVSYEFRTVRRLLAEAIGVPGKRTFRLLADNDAGSAIIWTEKEHLASLAMAIRHMLQTRDDPSGRRRELPEVPAPAPLIRLTVSFHADRFELGHDAETGEFMLFAHDWEVDETAPHTFSCRVPRAQLETLAGNIETVCAAGRPRCEICGLPINGPDHVHGEA